MRQAFRPNLRPRKSRVLILDAQNNWHWHARRLIKLITSAFIVSTAHAFARLILFEIKRFGSLAHGNQNTQPKLIVSKRWCVALARRAFLAGRLGLGMCKTVTLAAVGFDFLDLTTDGTLATWSFGLTFAGSTFRRSAFA